jgi:hypothetical protein
MTVAEMEKMVEQNLQFHFVVRWDANTKTWSVDSETLDAKFGTEAVWHEDTNTWLDFDDSEELKADYVDREDALADFLRQQNEFFHEER